MGSWRALILLAACLASATPASAGSGGKESDALPLPLDDRFQGDLDGMLERRRIRVLVVVGKTTFFVDRGTQRGILYDLLQE